MSFCLFWPDHLKERRFSDDDDLIAICIALKGTDRVVLDILREGLVRGCDIESPYSIVGVRKGGDSGWRLIDGVDCVVEFKAPRSTMLEFFSLEPISLSLPEKRMDSKVSNVNFIKISENKRYFNDNTRFKRTLGLINFYYTYLMAFHKKYPRFAESSLTSDKNIFGMMIDLLRLNLVYQWVGKGFFYITVSFALITNPLSKFLNWNLLNLVNKSATIQQIDLRCQQFSYFPVQYLRINENVSIRKAMPRFKNYAEASEGLRKDLPSNYYPDYIRFYNTVWLMLNDISFGMILGSFLLQYSTQIANFAHTFINGYLYSLLKLVTISLAHNPFGIKLNEELASFLSELFLWIIEFSYSVFIKRVSAVDNLTKIISAVANLSCIFGATFALSLLIDCFSFLSLHIRFFYLISRKLYHWQLNIMSSLFNLFCGKKFNVLRNRVDHHNFEIDQLLLGTLLFIILVFLLPTVLAFYSSYTIFQLGMLTLEIIFESTISLLNHFPLFALLLRIKDRRRIPGGIALRYNDSDDILRLKLLNKPLPVSLMFQPFALLMKQIKYNYCSSIIVNKLIKGLPITVDRNKLYQVLYSSLPSKPINIEDLYNSTHKKNN
ncbi:hypothetical protein Kpol_1050p47 [Vanderwaltozyma polyspora DSM 70294]|uniref:Uncharacterized protein n=1 Tax=Vanderwaltozyma polyspora (strain ATCC 22028 / DSM 70294 / BCRC 21397 / CBS 2163 / NBRC 10782 / NRRL Y-8283 / UCD 57-17) TaxID=436907 RepID=A7TEU4_VANPO|nr:uncharacterized protein Kpol_1050p47 [Vanderwaltozyma polyspora DSM 70294]EDO19190.1 hypothetical protein Kpol_1050p47 [Vanderwaltozyma polyspora DSM 70294]